MNKILIIDDDRELCALIKHSVQMIYLLYQLQEVIFYDGKTKRINADGHLSLKRLVKAV